MKKGENFESLYDKNIAWIRKKARELAAFYAPYSIADEDDLAQEALIELTRAAERYDESKSATQTSPLAYYRLCMLGQMINAAKGNSRNVHIPIHVVTEITATEQERRESRINEHVLAAAMMWWELSPESSDEFSYEMMLEKMVEEESEIVRQEERERVIDAMLKTLTPREERLLRLYYGFGDEIERSLDQVGDLVNLSRSRVSQILAKGIRKLRHPKRAEQLRDVV